MTREMNGGLKIKKLINGKVSPTNPHAATILILTNAQSKSVAVAATTQTHAHATTTHLLPHPQELIMKI